MFSWLISLMMLFGNHNYDNPANVTSVGTGGSGNRQVAPADSAQPQASDPSTVDGGGKPGG
jgi:hypothetical protein